MHKTITLHYKFLLLLLAIIIAPLTVFAQVEIAGWDFNGLSAYGSSPLNPTYNHAHVSVSGLSRGIGVTTTGTAATNAWGGNGCTGNNINQANSNDDYFSFSIKADVGYTVSLSSIEAHNILLTSKHSASKGQWQYKIDDGTYINIGTAINLGSNYTTSGNSQPSIPLNGFAALQNVSANSIITIRLVLWGESGTNNSIYFNNYSSTNNDFRVSGTVAINTNPYLNTDVLNLNGFTYSVTEGGPSEAQFFQLIGANLTTEDITITAPTHYEVSNNAYTGYASSLQITPTAGTVNETIYARLKSNAPLGTYYEEISILGGGVSAPTNLILDGVVVPCVYLWEEYFDSYEEETQNTAKWTTWHNDIDDGKSYWGTFNQKFLINNIEGSIACDGGGNLDNTIISQNINVNGYQSVKIRFSVTVGKKDLEGLYNGINEVAEGLNLTPGIDGNVTCTQTDKIIGYYSLNDGVSWIQFSSLYGGAKKYTYELESTEIPILNNTTLKIKIEGGCTANDDEYHIDNIIISGVRTITVPSNICINSTITATCLPIGGSWNSSNNTVATIDATGKISALSAGSTIISYTTCSGTSTAEVTVENETPTVTVTDGSVCGEGTVELQANANLSGCTINWYDNSLGGNLLYCGTNFTTPNISTSTLYYVEATKGACTSSRSIAQATIKPEPSTAVADGTTCLGGTVTFNAIADISGCTFKWYQNDTTDIVIGTDAIYTTPALLDTSYFYVEATADGCSSTRVKVTAYLSGKNTTWTGAVNNDWNNAANWTEGVPCSISNTTITDVSTAPNYPIITTNTACKNIVFEPGAAVLGLQYLSYEKAFVKTSLRRNIWYTLTAPLKEMYSGDYYFNGAPETFMQLFNAPSPDAIGPNVTYEGTFTRAFASLQVPLSLGQGFAYKLSEKTWNYPFGASKIPSDLDITFPRLNPDSSLLTSYIPYSAGNGMPYSFLAKTVTKNASLAYRFAAENAANQLTDITYTLEPGINLVGNPLMTHLDFNKLYLNNMAYIENKVKFWNGETFTTYITNQDLENAISSSDNTTNIIPPMQAFFVISPTGGTLTFDLENDFVANNSMKLRAASVKPNVLFIESDNGQMKSFAAIAKRQYAKNDFDSNDAFKLFSQHKNAPEVYTIANDMALDINQFEEFPFTVPLCIKTDSGNVMLSFNGVESFGNDVTIELINTKTGEVVDLKEENRYQYTVTPTKDEGSLFISFRNASLLTDIETIGIDHGIQIIANNQHAIKVISSPNDPIKEVLVFDVSGRKIQHACVSNTYNVELPVFVKNEIYLVQVFTENNTRIGKVLVK